MVTRCCRNFVRAGACVAAQGTYLEVSHRATDLARPYAAWLLLRAVQFCSCQLDAACSAEADAVC
jgi:hypothetical protein